MMQIEDIVLQHDQRGISCFKQFLAKNAYHKAAADLLEKHGTILITTGLAVNGAPETDGPPGAIFLAKALKELGFDVVLVTDAVAEDLFIPHYSGEFSIELFPIINERKSRQFAEDLLSKHRPNALIAIERCGVAENGKYLNMKGEDISDLTSRIDLLFQGDIFSIGIGDGGNEIGMGNLRSEIKESNKLVAEPTVIGTSHLLIASVSNWGAYGLIAAISQISGINLLPDSDDVEKALKGFLERGAIDGVTKKPEISVDGFDFEVITTILGDLDGWLNGTSLAP